MDEIPEVDDPEDVVEILNILKEELFDIMELDIQSENDYSFLVHFVPAFLPGSGSYEVINNFKLIYEGACLQSKSVKNAKSTVSLIELVVDEGSIKGHSYLITPGVFKGTFSNMGPGYYSYAFIRPATSGYSGTGPDIQRSIQEIIDDNIPLVKQRVASVNSVESLEGLFYERGPIVDMFFPNFEIPLGGFDYDKRFMEE